MSWIRTALFLALLPPLGSAQAYLLVHSGGGAAGGRLGTAVASLGDLDGDGTPDYAAGAPSAVMPGFGDGGSVRFFSGASGTELFTSNGTDVGELLGFSIANVGDINADGKADLLAGAPGTPGLGWPGFPPPLHGSIRILSGADGSVIRYLPGGSASSGYANRGFGSSVAGGGDVDGDGTADYIAGAPESSISSSPAGLSYAGKAAVFSGATGALLFSIGGTSNYEYLGRAVAILGDVSGDGRAEFLIGSSGVAGGLGGGGGGSVRVYSGATGTVMFGLNGATVGGLIGSYAAAVGDQDADGMPDFAIGIPANNPAGILNAGQVKVFSGATGALIRTIDGSAVHQLIGRTLADAGDVNGDGVEDLAAGGPQTLATTIPVGPGFVGIFSGATGALLYSATGTTLGDEFAHSLAAGGDLNADGLPDLLVGAPGFDASGGADSGVVAGLSWTGIPAGSSLFGSGCPGTGGFVPRISTFGGAPLHTGNPRFGLALSRALGGSSVLLVAGASSTSWNGLPLPLDLASFGAPGCFLRVSIEATASLTAAGAGPGSGTVFFPLPVPNDPGLANLTFYGQMFVSDPGPTLFPGAITAGLALVFQ